MKKQPVPLLLLLTIVFAAFTLGFFLGRNHSPEPVSLSVPAALMTEPVMVTEAPETKPTEQPIVFPIDLNTAQEKELMALPGIGEVLARRILAYRNEQGRFASVEELLNVEGIGKKRFEDMIDLITIGG